MKCFDCICAIRDENEELWCAKYKRIPTEEMAANCKHFLGRERILGSSHENEEVCE